MSRLTRDGTAEPVSRDQILRHARGQGNVHFPCSADHEQDWQPYPVDPYSAMCDDHTYILPRGRWRRASSPLGISSNGCCLFRFHHGPISIYDSFFTPSIGKTPQSETDTEPAQVWRDSANMFFSSKYARTRYWGGGGMTTAGQLCYLIYNHL